MFPSREKQIMTLLKERQNLYVSIQLFKEFRTAFECPINENFFHLSTEYTKIRSAGENNDIRIYIIY
jgi:hypothetical protein